MNQIHRYPDSAAAAAACAQQILSHLEFALKSASEATLAISGGSSPRTMFEIFAKTEFPWNRVQLFWVDERHVPQTDSQSNFKLANDTWLAPSGFLVANIHAVDTSVDPHESAKRYAGEVKRLVTRFDVVHQGMGPDCHTASLFPGEPLIDDRSGLAAAVWVGKFQQWRVTLLPRVLIAAKHTVMLIAGDDKAEALRAALYEPLDAKKYPSQLVTLERDEADLFLDEAAARLVHE